MSFGPDNLPAGLADAVVAFKGPREGETKRPPKATAKDNWKNKSGKRRG